MLPDKDEDAGALTALAILLGAITSLLSLAVIAIGYFVLGLQTTLGGWIFLVPLTSLMGGAAAALVAFATRKGEFSLVARTSVQRSATSSAVQILLGALGFVPGGLMVGGFLSVAGGNLALAPLSIRQWRKSPVKRSDLTRVAREYQRFPKHTLPGVALSTSSLQLVPVAISWLFGAATLGIWSLSQRLVQLPTTVVGAAISQTYYRHATSLRRDRESAMRFYQATLFSVGAGSLVVFSAVAFAGPWLATVVLGEAWESVGEYVRIMMPGIWSRFVASTVSPTVLIYEKNSQQTFAAAANALVLVLSVAASVVLDLQVESFLMLFSAGTFLVAAANVTRFWMIIKRSITRD